jgi:hypothetical protein
MHFCKVFFMVPSEFITAAGGIFLAARFGTTFGTKNASNESEPGGGSDRGILIQTSRMPAAENPSIAETATLLLKEGRFHGPCSDKNAWDRR